MDRPCSSDQERQAIFKDSLANVQQDLEDLSNGIYHRAANNVQQESVFDQDEAMINSFGLAKKRPRFESEQVTNHILDQGKA